MKKYLTLLTASTLLATTLSAKMDFFLGYETSAMTANNAANAGRVGLDETQKGIGFGLRIYTEANEDLEIGGEFALSHLETRSQISGSNVRAQFILKYHFSDAIEAFGGLGVAVRGTPDDLNTSLPSDATLMGGYASAGIAFMTEEGWRAELVYSYIPFTGKIDAVDETITTNLIGIHFGRTFDGI